MRSRTGICSTLLSTLSALSLVALSAAPASAASAEPLATTTFEFNPGILESLGLRITGVTASAEPESPGQLAFAAVPPSALTIEAPLGDFEGFESGILYHAGGFTLELPHGAISLQGFRLEFDNYPFMDLTDAAGTRWFTLELPQAAIDARKGQYRLNNVDLMISPELAARLGRADLAGTYMAKVDVAADGDFPTRTNAFIPRGGTCTPDFNLDRDLEINRISLVSQVARNGTQVAIAAGAEVGNIGPAAIEWNYAISPDSPLGDHPYLVMNFYRLADGRLEQIGREDLKHAFFAVNSSCTCSPANIFYSGCEDFYGSSTNSNTSYLSPRDELHAFTGAWTSLGSHFDATPVDDDRDHFGAADHDDYEHRLTLQEAELSTAGATYFIEGWYLVGDDIDLWNSMGHKGVTPTFGGSTWTFPDGAGFTIGSILDEFVDPVSPPAGAENVVLDTGEGRLQLAVETTGLGGGVTHYEYAVMNFDFDRQVNAFSLPLPPGASVSSIEFSDGDPDALNDWTGSASTHLITWTAPTGNELDWGVLYNFAFDVDASPVSGIVRMPVEEAGSPHELTQALLTPAADFDVETLTLFGEAEGGSVDVTVEGELVSVVTTSGESPAQVLANIAAAINMNATLAALGISASLAGQTLSTEGALSGLTLSDAGLSLAPPEVPALSLYGMVAVGLMLAGAALTPLMRRESGRRS